MLTDNDKKWLAENLVTRQQAVHFVTKDFLTGALAQLKADLMDEMNRVYRDLDRRARRIEDHVGLERE